MSNVDPRAQHVGNKAAIESFTIGQVIAMRNRDTRLAQIGKMTPEQRAALRGFAHDGLVRAEAAAKEHRELLADLLDPANWEQ